MPQQNQTFLIPKPSITNAFANQSLAQIRPGLNVDNVTSFSTAYYDNDNAIKWSPLQAPTSNIQPGSYAQRAAQIGASLVASQFGIPQVAQIGSSMIDSQFENSIYSEYAVADVSQNRLLARSKYPDFRARTRGEKIRLDGAAAAQRILLRGIGTGDFIGAAKSAVIPGLYAALSSNRGTAGAYNGFNREATYGWGDHDNPYALRSDFTTQSHVATTWGRSFAIRKKNKPNLPKGEWTATKNPLSMFTPFRGDKVNVIDFRRDIKLSQAYRWRPTKFGDGAFGKFLDKGGLTKDFIKFYITGPKLNAGNTTAEDDIIVFRASINSLTDTFGSNWSEVKLIGRADPNYQYSGYSRDISLDFTVFATDRDEVKPIWRKLNALAGYTAPQYDSQNIALVGSWLRITIGDLFVQQAAVIKSLNYTLYDAESPWEINIEQDPEMMEVPQKIDVSISLAIISDWLPQKDGRFYSLAKRFDGKTGLPLPGTDDWLSDTAQNPEILDVGKLKREYEEQQERMAKFDSEAPAGPADPDLAAGGNSANEVILG